MKKLILFIGIFFSFAILAQEQSPAKVKEYGIGLTSFNSFSLQYRWGNENRLYRIQGNLGGNTSFGKSSSNTSNVFDTISSNSSTSNVKTTSPINLNAGLSFSVLKIKSISEKFGLMYGVSFGSTYRYLTSESSGTGTTISNNSYYPNGTYPK